jgi:hypothetical protein
MVHRTELPAERDRRRVPVGRTASAQSCAARPYSASWCTSGSTAVTSSGRTSRVIAALPVGEDLRGAGPRTAPDQLARGGAGLRWARSDAARRGPPRHAACARFTTAGRGGGGEAAEGRVRDEPPDAVGDRNRCSPLTGPGERRRGRRATSGERSGGRAHPPRRAVGVPASPAHTRMPGLECGSFPSVGRRHPFESPSSTYSGVALRAVPLVEIAPVRRL